MKKIILIISLVIVSWLSYTTAQECTTDVECFPNTCQDWFCIDHSVEEGCVDNWWLVSWEQGDCNCTINNIEQKCEDIYTAEEMNSCEFIWQITYWKDQDQCCDWVLYDQWTKCCEWGIYVNGENEVDCCPPGTAEVDDACVSCDILTTIPSDWKNNCDKLATLLCTDTNKIYPEENGVQTCCPGEVVDSQENPWTQACIINTEWSVWLTMNADCLINGQCSYNIYETLWIRKSDPDPSVWSFVQDIVLAVTMFIGTVVAIVLVVSGILYILSSIRGSTTQAEMAKKGIVNSIMWLILVVSSYAIVRLVQFLATAGWW